jgi:hypothetical protein
VVLRRSAAGGGGDHGALQGLADNDHPQYALTSASLDRHPLDRGVLG